MRNAFLALVAALAVAGCIGPDRGGASTSYPYPGPLVDNSSNAVPAPAWTNAPYCITSAVWTVDGEVTNAPAY